MKILIFSVAYEPFVGGAEIAVKEITNRIPEAEFHMVTVNLDGRQKKQENIGNVVVHRIGRGYLGKLFFPFLGAWKGIQLHKAQNFNLVWSIMANYAGFAALFFSYARPAVRFVLTLQEGDPIAYIKRHVWFVYPLFVQIFRRADHIQTISHYLADFAYSMRISVPVDVIPNGVDFSLFQKEVPEETRMAHARRLGKQTGDIFLVTASRLVVKNGLADVIHALPLLPAHVKFLILGVGPLEFSLRTLARELGVERRVIFLGFVPYQYIPEYLSMSDIFIRPSLSEGMGNSFVEAMVAGVPVIATPVGGIPDFLKDGETGLFCEVNNSKSIAKAVERIFSDPVLRGRLISNAKEFVSNGYDWESIAVRMKSRVFGVKAPE